MASYPGNQWRKKTQLQPTRQCSLYLCSMYVNISKLNLLLPVKGTRYYAQLTHCDTVRQCQLSSPQASRTLLVSQP
jgi:hypothetical protein